MQKLLSISDLKKYFPLPKTKVFQRERLYVRANEEISIDIYEGETFGLVGESGCGKSTLGRTLLQLYDQTAGNTMYYGRSLASISPSYVFDTLKKAESYVAKFRKAEEKAKALTEKCEQLGDDATFFDLQEKNLAVAEAQTALHNVAKILGGFTVRDTRAGADLLLRQFRLETRLEKIQAQLDDLKLRQERVEEIVAERLEKGASTASQESKLAKLREKEVPLYEAQKNLEKELESAKAAVRDARKAHAGDAEFAEFDAFLDDGIDLSRLKNQEMRLLRKDLQVIFQDPYSSLNPRMTVGQIIEEGLLTHNFFKRGSKKMKEYVFDVMQQCGLQNYMYNRYPHQFSGGQRQRICIARSLAVRPKFVVCDECVSALDVSIQSQIINLLQELKEKEKLTYLFISHNLSVVRYISDRIGVMYLGNMVEVASTDVIFRDPRHPYTVALLSSIPTTDQESLTKERIILEGNIPSPIKPPSGCKFHTRCFMACEKCSRVPPPLVEVEPGHFVACHNLDRKLDEDGNYLFEVTTSRAKMRESRKDS